VGAVWTSLKDVRWGGGGGGGDTPHNFLSELLLKLPEPIDHVLS